MLIFLLQFIFNVVMIIDHNNNNNNNDNNNNNNNNNVLPDMLTLARRVLVRSYRPNTGLAAAKIDVRAFSVA